MRKEALWEQREETPVETRAHSSEAAFPSVTYPYTSPSTADTSDADTVHPGGPRRPRDPANAENVCERDEGRHPPSLVLHPTRLSAPFRLSRPPLPTSRRPRSDHLPLRTDIPDADAVHPSGSRRPPAAAHTEDVCEPEDGCIHRPPSFAPFALARRSALAGHRRADDPDIEGPAPTLRRQLCSRRRPPPAACRRGRP